MNWIQANKNFQLPPDGRYLVGISGGRDSVALLHWLLAHEYKNLILCHFNHRLRGSSSSRDAKFVQNLAAKYELTLETGSADVRALATQQKNSIETVARQARFGFFVQIAKKKGTQTIFLAHHADDLVETFLMNLFRGSGTTGLSAMREVSTRRMDDIELTIVRPFLGIWRYEIDEYVRGQRLKFREDESNKDLAALRNRIRNRIIPYLEKTLARNIRASIWRAAMIAAEEEDWIENQLPQTSGDDLPVAKLRDLPVALQRREILKWLRVQKIGNVGFEVVEEVRGLLEPKARVAKVNLPQNRHVRRRAGRIFIE